VAYSFNGVTPVEPNPEFLSQLKAVRTDELTVPSPRSAAEYRAVNRPHALELTVCRGVSVSGHMWFPHAALQATAGGKGIVTVCEAGGTLKPSTNFPLGKASRSLQAAYIAFSQGITDRVCMAGRCAYQPCKNTHRSTH
jgi:hypothetical protein